MHRRTLLHEPLDEKERRRQLCASKVRRLQRLGIIVKHCRMHQVTYNSFRYPEKRYIARHLVALPLPYNIHPERNKKRRVARVRALAETHASDSTVVYVDAAKHQYYRTPTQRWLSEPQTTNCLAPAASEQHLRRPHPKLGPRKAVLLRQLQTGTVLTLALARHVCPGLYESAKCSICAQELTTLTHVLWGCDACAGGKIADALPPDIVNHIGSPDHEGQLNAIQRLDAALARQKRTEQTLVARAGPAVVEF
ncbi:hypothetical protein HPB51_003898 [Rhipicephalus microplus]|uniref:Tick transposon n=1 Tax=Rhipicephalus microplus TaxID=6941 RepID=A0A9J6DTE0_RHIMP|nr:hypothetical protein HPB51_003898 [Rhipicephalus microplus]